MNIFLSTFLQKLLYQLYPFFNFHHFLSSVISTKNTQASSILNQCRRIPHFSKVCIMPLCFHAGPTLVPAFTNQQKPEEDFSLLWKTVQSENSIQHLFCREPLWRQATCTLSSGEGPAKLLPQGTTLSISAPSAEASNRVCERQCFIWIYFVYRLARSALRYQEKAKRGYFGELECSKIFSIYIIGDWFLPLCHFSFRKLS